MGALRALIVDDEPLARARLRRLLDQEDNVQIVAACANGKQAITALRTNDTDVAFLDIRMPDMDGFRVLDHLPADRLPHIVFVTAYSEHAVRAFETRALDYLLKPVGADRLHAAVARVRQKLIDDNERRLVRNAIPPAIHNTSYADRLTVSVGRHLRILAVADIDYAIAQANYVELHGGDRVHLVRSTIGGLAMRLDPAKFLRIHRSRIVRLDAIDSLEPRGAGQFLFHMKNGSRLISGRSYRDRIRGALGIQTPESSTATPSPQPD